MTQKNPEPGKAPSGLVKPVNFRNKLLWTVLSVGIAVLTVWAVTSYSRKFTSEGFLSYLLHTDPFMIAAGFACMLGFIFFEGAAIRELSRAFGYPTRRRDGLVYAASDIYFSAITPSATGGQPASAYFMMKDGMPVSVVSVVLLVNLVMYTLSILVLGVLSFVFHPSVFLRLGTLSRVLVILGSVIQCGLAFLMYLILRRERIFRRICRVLIHALASLHLIRNEEAKLQRLESTVEEYRICAAAALSHKRALIGSFCFNLLQRLSQLLVAVCAYLAAGGSFSHAGDILAAQNYVVLGSNCIPVPGAMGVADYLMLDAYGQLMSETDAVSLELLSRSISFYSCVILCGIAVLLTFFIRKKRKTQ